MLMQSGSWRLVMVVCLADDPGGHAHSPPSLLMDQPASSNPRALSMSASLRRILGDMGNTHLKFGADRITNAKDTEQRLCAL